MKQCTKCKEWKDESEFHKHKYHRDGLASQCKTCANEKTGEYRNSPQGKVAMQNYKQSKKGKEDKKKHDKDYRNSEKGKEAVKRYRQSEKGRVGRYIRISRWRERHPQERKAHQAVNKAVEYGKLPAISTQQCSNCGERASHYHHHSYEPEFWLDVIPLCQHCHSEHHREMGQ